MCCDTVLHRSGVRLLPVVQLSSEGVASSSGHLSDSFSSGPAPTRRLRFEDETETDAESRYLERQRQRRRAGQRGTAVLVCKPDLNLCVNGRAGPVVDRGGGVSLNLHLPVPKDRGRSLHRPHLHLLTEPIRETYIGSVTPGETRGEGGVTNHQVKRRTNQLELNGNLETIFKATPTTHLPINPYAPDQLTRPTSSSAPPAVTSARMGTAAAEAHRELRSWAELKERIPSVEEGGLDVRIKRLTAESPAPPTKGRQPMRTEVYSDDCALRERLISRDEPSRLSLRRLFSSVRLSRTRTGSLDRLSSRPRPSASDPPAPLGTRKSSGLLKKTASVQSLIVGSPFLQLRKSSSVQSFVSEHKKKKDRSADYRPAAEQFAQRCLSLEDVGCPSSVRSVGRVFHVFPDGTFLLEVNRPESRMFGFTVSRGRERPDSGVYVEDMVDISTEKLYAGLLAVGDEILEVNGEKVACLSLDQVTQLLTQNTSTTVRVLKYRRSPPR
ncbi:uncharacterized protein LOC115005856 [Cottoperca gobio]|uniref:Uncharacterized protein LOC115005856 n=1 Tax=Cottoperca gobio TaxID=56716 RepID=A0A6J2PC63_COTGO|nr:uncharacterized protein LOC115005856 [Cottoperca gobio]